MLRPSTTVRFRAILALTSALFLTAPRSQAQPGQPIRTTQAEMAFVQVAAGEAHSLAVGYDGTLWAWGSNAFGQLGNGTPLFHSSPVQSQLP